MNMELWYTTTSPFARKVRIAVAELGLTDQIALVRVDPWTDDRLRERNPLSKVPTLVLDDGTALPESSLICEWLDHLSDERKLCPVQGPDRWRALRLQGIADGAATAVGRLFADEHRPETERSEAMMVRFAAARDSVLDALEHEDLDGEPRIGEVAVLALLGYLDFRWPERDWRSGRPRLANWAKLMFKRPSMASTVHSI
jgi:glutathione S-transferase